MFVHLPTLAKLLQHSVSAEYFSPRRAMYTGALGGTHAALFATSAAARALDHARYPEFRHTRVKGPLFVVATPRSGTTYLEHLLGLDTQTFSDIKLFQTILPSISLYRAVDRVAALDRRAGAPLSKAIGALDKWMTGRWKDIHPLRLESSEEDENLFVYTLLTPALYLLFPFIAALPELRFVDEIDAPTRERLVQHYRESIQRHVYATRPERMPLIKNVLLTSRLDVARRAFPDARFVHLVRHPFKAIPSAISLFYAPWTAHSPEIAPNSPEVRALGVMFMEYYRRLHRAAADLGPKCWLTVKYEDFIANPVATVEQIYDWLGTPLDPEMRDKLVAQAEEEREFKSKHNYSLEEFGFTRAEVFAELRACFAAYGYEADGVFPSGSDEDAEEAQPARSHEVGLTPPS